MLIISKHKDYYDSAIGMGIDKTIVYEREEKNVKLETGYWAEKMKNPKIVTDIMDKLYPYTHSFSVSREIGFHVISFCGKIHIGFNFKNVLGKRDESYNDHEEIIYDKEEIIKAYQKIEEDDDKWYWNTKSLTDKKGLSDFNNIWNDLMNIDTTEYHREFNSPVFVVKCRDHYYNPKLIINPILKDYLFVRIYDPYTAFQEIQMYLGGVLASGDDIPETEMSEKQKVNQHGFDDKYGFRKRPKKNKSL